MALLSMEELILRFPNLRAFGFTEPLAYVATQKSVWAAQKNAYLMLTR